MSRAPKPQCVETLSWLRVRLGRQALAPLTGMTGRVLNAYIHLVAAWCSAGSKPELIQAMRSCVACLQRSEWQLAAWAIVAIGDWGHVEELWPLIKPAEAPMYIARPDVHVGEFFGALHAVQP